MSEGVLYFNAFFASCNVIQSLVALSTMFFIICFLSLSVPHNHIVNHIASALRSCASGTVSSLIIGLLILHHILIISDGFTFCLSLLCWSHL